MSNTTKNANKATSTQIVNEAAPEVLEVVEAPKAPEVIEAPKAPEVIEANEVVLALKALDLSANMAEVITKVNEIIALVNNQKSLGRNRGPDSTREMTVDDAKRIMLGDLKGSSHKEAAEALGLSYGQIYSARGGYTFKAVYKEANSAPKVKSVK